MNTFKFHKIVRNPTVSLISRFNTNTSRMQENTTTNILTHETKNDVNLNEIVEQTRKRIVETGESVQERLDILKQLTEFEFGRYLLINRGLTGYWTRYINLYPKRKHEYNVTHPLEKFMLEGAPGVLASQQRFVIFQTLLKEHIKSGMKVCSLPCGLMDDLLTLDLTDVHDVQFVGIDIDQASIDTALENAKRLNLDSKCSFLRMDAWTMEFKNEFDILTSNMLVQYVTDEEAILKLYKLIYASLKENGIFMISSLLQPDYTNTTKYDIKDIKRASTIFYDVIQVKWTNYQPVEKMIRQFKEVGFKSVDVHYDEIKRMPTLLARK